jgi:hypothetical protein
LGTAIKRFVALILLPEFGFGEGGVLGVQDIAHSSHEKLIFTPDVPR